MAIPLTLIFLILVFVVFLVFGVVDDVVRFVLVLVLVFVPAGHVLRVHQGNISDRRSFISGYRLGPGR